MPPSTVASVSVPLTSLLFILDGYGASSVSPRQSAVMDLSAKSLNPNKRLKEDFVSNLTGSSMLEIAVLLLIVPALVLLRQLSSFSSERGLASTNIFVRKMNDRETSKCKDLRSSTLELSKDFAIVILPVILVFTVLAEWVYFLAIILIVVLLFCISAKRPSFSTLNTEMGPQHLSSSKMSILSYRVFMVVITCICILAVDFKIFPRRYAKTETYGTGLMDLGVGSFVVANSLVSRQARGIMFVNWKIALQSVSPLVLLGAGRLIFTAGVEYQVHVGEYGVHWNFFFTLAAISLLTSIFHIHPKYCGIFGLVILIAYQTSLKYGLSNFLLSSERASDIISQNKEGLFSIFVTFMEGTACFVLSRSPSFLVSGWTFFSTASSRWSPFCSFHIMSNMLQAWTLCRHLLVPNMSYIFNRLIKPILHTKPLHLLMTGFWTLVLSII